MSKKLQNKEYSISTLKGVIGAIPFAGTLVNELLFDARSRIKQERVNEFIIKFSELIDEHTEEDFSLLNLNNEQLSDILEEIIISVSKTSAEHKKEIFKKILLNQLKSSEVDTDDTLRFVNITNEINNRQFEILKSFHSLSDKVLKYKVQILELKDEARQLNARLVDLKNEYVGSKETSEKIEKRLKDIPKLIKRREMALTQNNVNPNTHSTFNISRELYITEMHDLIAKGLLFDFAIRTNLVQPFVHFGITQLGRSYMKYIIDE
ncbi:hypothetical protein KXJ69_08310 [Aureisphaera sp. CAU 1614]|uniref:Uncharacterized protein n=1 Tax=Halomarinibacterium sedimenti TaxID=2857106 RepID=A0A9X1FPM3_9FLAO|nr:hypothetical protein [Halomarinibacterium sedimenti]MBW2938107.1 hypothetical protein [Halomarinibacterium sedimenti]